MPRRKSHDEFVQEVYDLVGDEYTVIGTYKLSSIKLDMKHNECNFVYPIRPSAFLKGQRCPDCFSPPRKTFVKRKASHS
jgi:hypothetical protein